MRDANTYCTLELLWLLLERHFARNLMVSRGSPLLMTLEDPEDQDEIGRLRRLSQASLVLHWLSHVHGSAVADLGPSLQSGEVISTVLSRTGDNELVPANSVPESIVLTASARGNASASD